VTAQWPKRTSVCRECRTAYVDGETGCDKGDKHTVLSLSDEEQREQLVSEVWGPPSARRQAREAAAAGGAGGASAGAAECGGAECTEAGCETADLSGCGDAAGSEIGAVLLAIAVVAIVCVAAYFIIRAIVRYVRKRRAAKARENARLKPRGALTRPKGMGKRTGYVGKVVGKASIPDPITGEDCVAYGVKLRTNRHLTGDIMLRDAATVGFDIELDSGEVVRVPAGRVVMDLHGADKLSDSKANRELVDAYLSEIDLYHGSIDTALPWDKAHLRLIRAGDRVSLRGDVERAVDTETSDVEHGYRDAAASILVPRGVPQLILTN
jgi:hypothetical protein